MFDYHLPLIAGLTDGPTEIISQTADVPAVAAGVGPLYGEDRVTGDTVAAADRTGPPVSCGRSLGHGHA